MKAIRIHEYGSSEQLKYEETITPIFNENEVLVKIHATSVNHLEMMQAAGKMKENNPLQFPWIPGYDFAGIVERKGDNVTDFEIGDRVYGNCKGGSYAEYVAADTNKMTKIPESLSFKEAATVPHVGETAWQAIHTHGQLQKGQSVLIQGAAGAVGGFAVQFAHLTGAKVYATVSFDDKSYVESLGADVIIDYKSTDFTTVAKDMDLVIDLVGGETQQRSYSVIKPGGRLVSTVGVKKEGKDEARKNNVTAISMVIEQSREDLEKITQLFNENKLQCDVELTYFLEDAPTAWNVLLGKDPALPKLSHGKVVLQVINQEGKDEPVVSHIENCENCY